MVPSRRTLVLGAAAAALLGGTLATLAATARQPVARHWRPAQPAFRVTVVDDGGSPLRTFSHQGLTFVLGERGERYAVRIDNPTSRRVEAVISIDGRDGVSGRRADFARDRGYVIPPFGSTVVRGFRTSLDDVAAFRFTDPGDSYSARRGSPENVGVIGVAFFTEREREVVARPWRSAPGSAGAAKQRSRRPTDSDRDNLGTEFGEQTEDHVSETSFVRAAPRSPARVITLRYDDQDGLEARGIEVVRRWRRADREPEAFPGRFAPPPR